MIRINKNLTIFLGILLITLTSLFIFLQKLPRLASHAVYYCQSSILSLVTPIPQPLLLLPFALLGLFAIFALLKLMWMITRAYKLKKRLIQMPIVDQRVNALLTRLKIKDKVLLVESNRPFAFCMGVFRPKIYISSYLLTIVDMRELEVILRHERYHLRSKDTLVMLIASFTAALLPFLPAISDAVNNYRIEREIKADSEAMRGKTKLALISVLKKLLKNPAPSYSFVPAIVDYTTLESRIVAITSKNIPKFNKFGIGNLIVTILFLAVISFALVGPVHGMHIHSDDSHLIMLHSDNDSCLEEAENLNVHPE